MDYDVDGSSTVWTTRNSEVWGSIQFWDECGHNIDTPYVFEFRVEEGGLEGDRWSTKYMISPHNEDVLREVARRAKKDYETLLEEILETLT